MAAWRAPLQRGFGGLLCVYPCVSYPVSSMGLGVKYTLRNFDFVIDAHSITIQSISCIVASSGNNGWGLAGRHRGMT